MKIGTRWYYQHDGASGAWKGDSMYAIKKEIIDTLTNGVRVVNVTNIFLTKMTTSREYLYSDDGRLYHNIDSGKILEDYPRYDADYRRNKAFGMGYGYNWSYEIGAITLFGIPTAFQKETILSQSHAGSSSENYTTAVGLGIIRTGLIPTYFEKDTSNLVGIVKDGQVFGDTVVVYEEKIPHLLFPTDRSSNDVGSQCTFVWRKFPGARWYNLEVSTDSSFRTRFWAGEITGDTLKTIQGFANKTEYFWRVIATLNAGLSPYSRIFRFTTIDSAVAVPLLVSPADSATQMPQSLTCVWQTVPRSRGYRLQVSTSQTFDSLMLDDTLVTDTVRSVTGLANATRYYWRVQSTSVGGDRYWSAVWSFFTKEAEIQEKRPHLIFPADRSRDEVGSECTFVWRKFPGARWYNLEVSTDSTFGTYFWAGEKTEDTLTTLKGLAHKTEYYWRVIATLSAGLNPYSSVFRFTTIDSAVAVPLLVSPAD
ncbi:MAG TPA: hypothetical protein VK470_06605, partial [Bacteroidota bacterium]|nr:hypothetical protein [Bacteroidota bacterium]